MTWERLDAGESLHWPCTHRSARRARRGSSSTGSRRPTGWLGSCRSTTSARRRRDDAAYPLVATTGRVLAHYQSGAQTRLVDELTRRRARCSSRSTPTRAAAAGLADGDLVDVVSRRGRTRGTRPASTTTMRPDTVFLPFHWAGDGRANSLTHAALDPTSRMPEFKACAVRLEPAV